MSQGDRENRQRNEERKVDENAFITTGSDSNPLSLRRHRQPQGEEQKAENFLSQMTDTQQLNAATLPVSSSSIGNPYSSNYFQPHEQLRGSVASTQQPFVEQHGQPAVSQGVNLYPQNSLNQLLYRNVTNQVSSLPNVQNLTSTFSVPVRALTSHEYHRRLYEENVAALRETLLTNQTQADSFGGQSVLLPTQNVQGQNFSVAQGNPLVQSTGTLVNIPVQSLRITNLSQNLGLANSAISIPFVRTNFASPVPAAPLYSSSLNGPIPRPQTSPSVFLAPTSANQLGSSVLGSEIHQSAPMRAPSCPPQISLARETPTTAPATESLHQPIEGGESKKTGKLDEKWMRNFRMLEKFKREHGNCIVPRGFTENPRLASWVAEQRKLHKAFQRSGGTLAQKNRIDMLNSLQFTWDAQDAAWQRNFGYLCRFRDQYGHCNVPINNTEYPKLGLWVKEQRRHYMLRQRGRKSHITTARIEALEKLGFHWDSLERAWNERFDELVQYKRLHGDCNVPAHAAGYHRLATWVQHQRRQYRELHRKISAADSGSSGGEAEVGLTAERIRRLTDLGFDWDPRNVIAKASLAFSSEEEEG